MEGKRACSLKLLFFVHVCKQRRQTIFRGMKVQAYESTHVDNCHIQVICGVQQVQQIVLVGE